MRCRRRAGRWEALHAPDRPALRRGTDAELRETLEHVLAERLGWGPAVLDIERLRSEHSSSYETEVLTVRLAQAGELRLFLKDFGASAYEKDSMSQRRSRELCVYRDLLAAADLETPAFYGAVWEESRGRFWLLLELIEGTQVRYCSFEEWVRAAAWLGRMQAHFVPAEAALRQSKFLVSHDREFFLGTAERARRAMALGFPHLERRLTAALRGYSEAVKLMVAQPRTLVHGGYRPQNILRAGPPEAPRIAPADWEEAAFGSVFYDLAYFTDGFEADRLSTLVDAWRREALRYGLRLPVGAHADRLLDLFNLHKNLGTLSKAFDRRFPEEGVVKLVGIVESVAARVL